MIKREPQCICGSGHPYFTEVIPIRCAALQVAVIGLLGMTTDAKNLQVGRMVVAPITVDVMDMEILTKPTRLQ